MRRLRERTQETFPCGISLERDGEEFHPLLAAEPMNSPVGAKVFIERIRSTIYAFNLDRRGATALEFAIVFIPFMLFVLIVFQIALYHFGLQSLDHATRLASRKIMLGEIDSSWQTSDGFKRNAICANFILNFQCDNVVVAATKVASDDGQGPGPILSRFIDLSQLTLQPQASSSFCIGGPGDYIFLDISYVFPNLLGSFFVNGSVSSDTFALRSTNFFRNEPYKGAGAGC